MKSENRKKRKKETTIELESIGLDEIDAIETARYALEEYHDSCNCGLVKAINLSDKDELEEWLTPAMATVFQKWIALVQKFRYGLIDNCINIIIPDARKPLKKALNLSEWGDYLIEEVALKFDALGIPLAKALRMRPHEKKLFPLNQDRLNQLWKRIKDYTDAFMYQNLGISYPQIQIDEWLKSGLIDKTVDFTDYLNEAYKFSRLVDALNHGADYTQMKRIAATQPLMPYQEAGAELFKAKGCRFIKGIANEFEDQLTAQCLAQPDYEAQQQYYQDLIKEATEKEEKELKAKINEVVRDAEKARLNRKQLASELRNQSADWGRDWDRIAITEFVNLENQGRADDIKQKHYERTRETDPWVAKIPKDTACKGCKKLFLLPDGSPRPFRMSELEKNGSNGSKRWFNSKTGRNVYLSADPNRIYFDEELGKFTAEKGGVLPTIDSVHPNCACPLIYYPSVIDWTRKDDQGRSDYPLIIRKDKTATELTAESVTRLATKMKELMNEKNKQRG